MHLCKPDFINFLFLVPLVLLMVSIACDAKGGGFKVVLGQSGYWRLAQNEQGVWWFLSPDNRLEFLTTVTSVRPIQKSREQGRFALYLKRLEWQH